jgi:hypothetical protein
VAYILRDIYGNNHPIGLKLQIGSDVSNQIVLQDPQVSPFHATLWVQQGNLFIQDNSGINATFVNRVAILGPTTLQIGDQISIGSALFTVAGLDEAAAIINQVPKKRIGCRQWLLIGAATFMVECLCLAAGGFYLYSTDVEIKGTVKDLSQNFSGSPDTTDSPPSGTDQPGPEILTLSDVWLFNNKTNSYSQHDERTVEGLTPAGAAIKTNVVFNSMEQTSPEYSSYILIKKSTNGSVVDQYEAATFHGVIYSGSQTCESSPDPKNGTRGADVTPITILTNELTGHMKRVETGVTINDVITDRYEIRPDNFQTVDSIVELKSGSLYRARDGGYMAQLEYVVVIKPKSWVSNISDDFSDKEPSTVTYHYDRSYVPDETFKIKVPEVCVDKVKTDAGN